MLLNDKIEWREPLHHSRADALAELKASGLLSPKLWIRLTLIAILVVAPLFAWGMWAFPAAEVPWARIIIGLIAQPVLIIGMAAVSVLIPNPRYVRVSREWIDIVRGQGSFRIKRQQLDRVEIVESKADERCLVIEYRARRGRLRNRSIVIGESVDMESLRALVEHLAPCKSLDPTDARLTAVHAGA